MALVFVCLTLYMGVDTTKCDHLFQRLFIIILEKNKKFVIRIMKGVKLLLTRE
jgi:hypothetical protein